MIRAQVQFTESEMRRLRLKASERNVSIASLVREAVERSLNEDDRGRRFELALAVMGRFHSGSHDVSANHDRYLDEAFASCPPS